MHQPILSREQTRRSMSTVRMMQGTKMIAGTEMHIPSSWAQSHQPVVSGSWFLELMVDQISWIVDLEVCQRLLHAAERLTRVRTFDR